MKKKIILVIAIIIFVIGITVGGIIVRQYLSAVGDEIADLRSYKLETEKEKTTLANECIGKAEAELVEAKNYLREDNAEDNTKEIQNHINNAVYYGILSTNLNSTNSELWFRRGNIYLELIDLVEGAEEWALKCYKKALELDPDNRTYYLKVEELTK